MKFFLRTSLVLTGLLVIGVIMLTLGKPETAANPSAESYGPSGLSAFADLLRSSGYQVRLDRRAKPIVRPGELAIAVNVYRSDFSSLLSGNDEESSDDQTLDEVLESDVSEGAVLLTGSLMGNYQAVAAGATPHALMTPDSEGKPNKAGPKISISSSYVVSDSYRPSKGDATKVWLDGSQAMVSAYAVDKGVIFALGNSLFLTNRFIDKEENARFGLSLVRSLAADKRVVFIEAAAGNISEPSLLEALGLWVKYGWIQFLFAAAVIAYAAGKRFGLPIYDPFVQRGQRDLVEAVGFLYHRARADETALTAVIKNADRDLRKSLKLSFDAPVEKRNEQLPPSLLAALDHAARVASIPESPEIQVLAAARRVEREVEAFIGSRTIIRTKRRKR